MQYQKVYIKQFRLHVANKYLAFADRLTSRLTQKRVWAQLLYGPETRKGAHLYVIII